RDPRVVHDVDVELPRLLLAVVERLREPAVVRLGQQLDADPRLLLEQRHHLLLERRQRAVLERAENDLAARLAAGAEGRRGGRGAAAARPWGQSAAGDGAAAQEVGARQGALDRRFLRSHTFASLRV